MLYFNINSYPFINQIYQQALYSFITKGYLPNYCMINNGKKILSCADEIMSYQAHYYVHHTAKLDQAYNLLNLLDLTEKSIQIFDWGCGQGLGTLVLLEKLGIKYVDTKIDSITFIDPSLVSIITGRDYLNSYLSIKHSKIPKINMINKSFDELNRDEFISTFDNLQFHILSNIIDINTYNMNKLTDSIYNTTLFKGIVILVSPNYSTTQWRIMEFEDKLINNMNITVISNSQYQIYADVFHINSRSNRIVPVKNIIKIYEIERSKN